MLRALSAITLVILLFGACTQRMVCPAYQSAFIYDKDVLRKKFSYFQQDSTPKIYSASKTKYLIAEPTSYRKKVRTIQTVAMRPVNVVLPDSLSDQFDKDLGKDGEDGVVPGAELDLAARSVIDSTYIIDVPRRDSAQVAEDSVYVISKDKELRLLKYNFPDSLKLDASTGRYVPETPKYAVVNITFNVEQDNYMWYLKDYLVLPDVRLARNQQRNKGDDEAGQSGKKAKGFKGFFKNLFKKKKKQEAPPDEVPVKKSDEEEFDFIDEDQTDSPAAEEQPQQEKKKKKKGLLRRSDDDKSDDKKPEKEEKKQDKKEPPKDDQQLTIPEEQEDGF